MTALFFAALLLLPHAVAFAQDLEKPSRPFLLARDILYNDHTNAMFLELMPRLANVGALVYCGADDLAAEIDAQAYAASTIFDRFLGLYNDYDVLGEDAAFALADEFLMLARGYSAGAAYGYGLRAEAMGDAGKDALCRDARASATIYLHERRENRGTWYMPFLREIMPVMGKIDNAYYMNLARLHILHACGNAAAYRAMAATVNLDRMAVKYIRMVYPHLDIATFNHYRSAMTAYLGGLGLGVSDTGFAPEGEALCAATAAAVRTGTP